MLVRALQAAAEASAQLEEGYMKLQQSWMDQKARLTVLIEEQHSSAAALLTSAKEPAAITKRELDATKGALNVVREVVHKTCTGQNNALTDMEHAFTQQIGQEQVRCMTHQVR